MRSLAPLAPLAALLAACVPALHGQDVGARATGEAILAACGPYPAARVPAVVAGTVADSVSGVPLGNARVRMEWQESGDSLVSFAETRTDERGYFQFCDAPAGEEIAMVAILRAASAPVTFVVEPAVLQVERILIPLSDPAQPGLLVGRVIDAASRQPITNAEVSLDAVEGARTLTNESGYFSLGRLPWGAYTISAHALGYLGETGAVRIQGGMTESAEIRMSPAPIPITGIDVTVRGRLGRLDLDALVRRMRTGLGTFLARDAMERRPNARVVDLLREVPGIAVRYANLGPDPILEVRGRSCTPAVYVDGTYWPFGLTDATSGLIGSEIEAIEVYKGLAETPGEFYRAQRAPCATIVIWTR